MGSMIDNEAEANDIVGGTRIQSVSRAARLLLAVASSDDGLTVKEVASRFDLSTPTAYHLLNTLVHERLLFKDRSKRYLLGPGASVIAGAYNRQNPIPERYSNALNVLAEESGETAYLSAWQNGAIAVLASVEGSHAVRVAGLTAGYSENVHARASGKLLLAFASHELRESVLRRTDLTAITPHTIVSRAELDREFELIREQDLAWDRQEFREGVECVSAPIRENGVVVACLTLSCPAERFALRKKDLVQVLVRATRLASEFSAASA